MANILFSKIQFISSNPFGEFLPGDQLEFYYETTAPIPPSDTQTLESSGITVYKNGVQIFTGALIHWLNAFTSGTFEETLFGGQCNGTTFVEHSRLGYMEFPYYWNFYSPNYPECAVNPPSCNLVVIGVPMVTSASSQTTADGEISIVASSSLQIQYKLGYDFTYNDGSGHQATGQFIGLLPGTYRIYLRDENNCFANVSVTVTFNNTYSTYYRLEYDDPTGGVTRIDIVKRDYAGGYTEVLGSNAPFQRSLRGEGSIDKFIPMLPTSVNVGITAQTNFQFQSIYTNNPEEFRIHFYKNEVLKGVYKVLPQQGSEDYKSAPYYFNIVGTDALPQLRTMVFMQPDGQRFTRSMKAIELIAYILKKTKIELNIRVAINMYASGMNTTDADDPLDQIYVDTDTYYIHQSQPDLEYVLMQILEPFGARILQENAIWWIVRVEELRGEFEYREFDANGDYLTNGSYDPLVNIVPPGNGGTMLSDSDHFMTLCPGYGKIRVLYKLGLRPNILENGDFRLKPMYIPSQGSYSFSLDTFGFQLVQSGYHIDQSWETIDALDLTNIAWILTGGPDTTGNAYVQSQAYSIKMGLNNTLKIKLRFKIPAHRIFGFQGYELAVPYQKVRIRVKYGSFYLLGDGTWSTTENVISFYITDYDKYLETEVIASQPDTASQNGYELDVRVYHSFIYHAEFSTTTDLKAKVTYDVGNALTIIPVGARSEVAANSSLTPMYYYEFEGTTASESIPSIVRPNDYHATNNPFQWVLKTTGNRSIVANSTFVMAIDTISVKFLESGRDPLDTILREIQAEPRNSAILEKGVTHGSYQSFISTLPIWDFGIGRLMSEGSASLTLINSTVLSADLIYAGYFRDVDGNGYLNWVRDGMDESDTLHGILLKQYAAQYKRQWRKLTGSLYSADSYFSFLDVFILDSDDDTPRTYIPVAATIDDKNNRYIGELVEISDVTLPENTVSAFTRGFKQSGYN